jgi:hypothetical protein
MRGLGDSAPSPASAAAVDRREPCPVLSNLSLNVTVFHLMKVMNLAVGLSLDNRRRWHDLLKELAHVHA